MTEYSVRAEWESLSAVRVHTPGVELWSGSLDPEANLFDRHVAPEQARREHERIVGVLSSADVEVHQLADDLARAGVLDDLLEDALEEEDIDIDGIRSSFDDHEKLQIVLSRPGVVSSNGPGRSIEFDHPISNIYFQRDTTILGDEGPILCNMQKPIRQLELPLVREAWSGIGATIRHEMEGEPIEGGEFLPAGEFALLGVSAIIDGEEHVIRTSYDAGEALLEEGAVGYDEVGLVRSPLAADRRLRQAEGLPSRIMHLLGWCNIAAEGLAVVDADLAREAEVDVYRRTGRGYEYDHSSSTLEYVRDEKGFDVVEVAPEERWPTNFLAIDDGAVVPLYEPGDGGAYRPERNPTIETLKERGVRVVPNGEGIPRGALTDGAGGLHCMTTPISRN